MQLHLIIKYSCILASLSIANILLQFHVKICLTEATEIQTTMKLTPLAPKSQNGNEIFNITDRLCKKRDKEMVFIKTISTIAYRPLVIIHDGQQSTHELLSLLKGITQQISLILVDFGHLANAGTNWLKRMQSELYTYILVFHRASLVINLLDRLGSKTFLPKYLLLLDMGSDGFELTLLNHQTLNKVVFLSLLRPTYRSCRLPTRMSIDTYNTFSKNSFIKYRQRYEINQDLDKENIFPDRFKNFLGYHFHLASWGNDFPYIVNRTGGICVIMLREIARKLNFTFQVYNLPPDGQWGSFVNGSWRGMIGEVYYGHKDFGINQMDIVEDRYQAVDFGVPFWTSNSRFLIQNPEPPPRWSSIVFPFSWMTWVTLMITLTLVGFTYSFFFKVLRLPHSKDYMWIMLDVQKTILGLDCFDFSYYSSITVLIGIWRLAAMVISISYRGNLIAYISVPPAPLRLQTLHQLASSRLTPIMTDYGSYLPTALKTSNDTTLRTLGERLEIIPYDHALAFDMVYDGSYALLEESSFLHSLVVSYNVYNAYYLPESLNKVYMGWYFPKNTPWKYKFDHFLSIFTESGLTNYWYKEVKENYEQENNLIITNTQEQRRIQPLTLADLQGVFVVYGFGVGVSLSVAITETMFLKNGLRLKE